MELRGRVTVGCLWLAVTGLLVGIFVIGIVYSEKTLGIRVKASASASSSDNARVINVFNLDKEIGPFISLYQINRIFHRNNYAGECNFFRFTRLNKYFDFSPLLASIRALHRHVLIEPSAFNQSYYFRRQTTHISNRVVSRKDLTPFFHGAFPVEMFEHWYRDITNNNFWSVGKAQFCSGDLKRFNHCNSIILGGIGSRFSRIGLSLYFVQRFKSNYCSASSGEENGDVIPIARLVIGAILSFLGGWLIYHNNRAGAILQCFSIVVFLTGWFILLLPG